MTPTLRSIYKAMDSTLKAMKKLDQQSNKGATSKAYEKAERDIRQANNAILKFSNYTSMAAREAHEVNDAWQDVNATLNQSTKSVGSMMNSIASGIYTIKNGIQAISKLTDIADAATGDMAKLSLFNNTGTSDLNVYKHIYDTAQASRSDLSSTADLTQRVMLSGVYEGEGAMGNAIDLAGMINKAMVLGGGSSEENNRAILQLSQALSSGLLQGDELRSIREQSPYLAKVLAEGLGKIDDKFIGTTIGDLKELGAQGELTSRTVIEALQAMKDEINTTFDAKAPKTFSGAMTSIHNSLQFFMALLNQSGGALDRINKAAWEFADFLGSAEGFQFMSSLASVLTVVAIAFQFLGKALQFVGSNIGWIGPIFGTLLALLGAYITYLAVAKAVTWAQGIAQGIAAVAAYAKAKADERAALAAAAAGSAAAQSAAAFAADAAATAGATAAQHGFNAALWACPITWIIVAIIIIIGLIFIVVGIINQVAGTTISAVGIIVGCILAAVSIVWNLFLALTIFVIKNVVLPIATAWDIFANAFGNLFNDPIATIISTFHSLANAVLSILQTIANAIDAIFGSNLSGAVSGWIGTLGDKAGALIDKYGNGNYENKSNLAEQVNQVLNDAQTQFSWSTSDAFNTGYDFGSNLQDSFSGLGDFDFGMNDALSMLDGLANPSGGNVPTTVDGGNLDSVDKINDDVNIGDEDIKLLRDMAARDFLLQLQSVTPVANITFGDVKETADVGKIIEVIENMVEEQMATSLIG